MSNPLQAYSFIIPSGSTNYRAVQVTDTASPGQTFHTQTGAGFDSLYMFACNNSTSDVTLTVEWGGSAIGQRFQFPLIAKSGLVEVIDGWQIANGGTVALFCGTASVVNVFGWVTRIS